ncbi:MAG: hypothetical protein C4520_18225 [Candidatus Abyssobacteria bacterium SURF_5]|uniref:Uncharacterized protein n=1 Tax=Abyssobacteria bacterium (strain SURF_5) TaxID=2093360 RepID=A0A3A4NM32_ABYX5|nr:MAG: hypothetical protein C4520_18225 [Candidatus Abyssubacteria bacterium SURF_5]
MNFHGDPLGLVNGVLETPTESGHSLTKAFVAVKVVSIRTKVDFTCLTKCAKIVYFRCDTISAWYMHITAG